MKINRAITLRFALLICLMGIPLLTHGDSIPSNRLNIQIAPSKYLKISIDNIKEEKGITTISGRIRRRFGTFPFWGHIDLAVVGPNREVLHQAGTLYHPSRLSRHRALSSQFTARIPSSHIKDLTLYVAYHNGEFSFKASPQCTSNAALRLSKTLSEIDKPMIPSSTK